MKKKFRKNWIIYPKFQFLLIGANLVIMTLVWFLSYFFIRKSFNNLIQEGIAAELPADHPYFGFVNYQSDMIFNYLAWCVLIAFVLSTIASIYISHKVAGPIVRLKSFFKGISEGNQISKISFRKGDFFFDLPQEINNALEKIKK